MSSTVIARECRFAVHLPARKPNIPDLLFVKEQVHYDDGRIEPEIRRIKDYQRPFWVTKPEYQNHQEKKEAEYLNRLVRYECTDSALRTTVAEALDQGRFYKPLRELLLSPYVYGTDVPASVHLRQRYRDKWPNVKTPYSVATFDVETNMFSKEKEIIIASIAFQDKIYTAVLSEFLARIPYPDRAVEAAMERYLPRYLKQHGYTAELALFDNEIDIVKAIFQKAHAWRPDFLAIWNVDFDVSKVINACRRANIDPAEVFSDPSIPKPARLFRYKRDKSRHQTAKGTSKPVPAEMRWHWVTAPASFLIVDAMATYRRVRIGEQDEPRYALDHILQKELGTRKLNFEEAEGYVKGAWHRFMQQHHPVEYIVYNRYDCWGMLELEAKTNDLGYKLPTYVAQSDFGTYAASTKKATVSLYYYYLQQGQVISSVGSDRKFDDEVVVIEDSEVEIDEDAEEAQSLLDDWIVTLQAQLAVRGGVKCIAEDPTLPTGIRGHVYDSDSVTSYPRDVQVANVSKATTRRELISIDGVPKETFRMQNLNFLSGEVNAVEYMSKMCGFPELPELLKIFKAEHGLE